MVGLGSRGLTASHLLPPVCHAGRDLCLGSLCALRSHLTQTPAGHRRLNCGFLSGAPFTSDGLLRGLGSAEAGFVDRRKARPLTFFVQKEAPDFLRTA